MSRAQFYLIAALIVACGKTESGDGAADAVGGSAGSTGGVSGSGGAPQGGSGGTSVGGLGGGAGAAGASGAGGAGNTASLDLIPACIEFRNAVHTLDVACIECISDAEGGACSAHYQAFFESEACEAASQCMSGCFFCSPPPCDFGTCKCEAACAGCGPAECPEALRQWYLCATAACREACGACDARFGASCSGDKDCCSLRCVGGSCVEGEPAACLDAGSTCFLDEECCSRTCGGNGSCTELACGG